MSKTYNDRIAAMEQENKEYINRLFEEQRKHVESMQLHDQAEISTSTK